MSGEEGVPVWGVEFGNRRIRAARVSRRPEGGFWLLDFAEETVDTAGVDGLLPFLRRRKLWGHPLVLALESPSAIFRSVALSPAESGGDDPRDALLEYVHPEPEQIEVHSRPLGPNLHLLCAEDRARVESTLIALERADLPAYALVPADSALYETVRRTGLFEGNGLVVHVGETYTRLLFLDGDGVRQFALPLGEAAVADPAAREGLAADVRRLLEYHRTRAPAEGAERIVLLGVSGPAADAFGAMLPARPLPFPGDAGPVRGKGRISMERGVSLLRLAPAAIGAAIAGASDPRHLEIAYRRLPDVLPPPPRGAGAWIAAALVLWLAAGITFLGVDSERRRLSDALDRPVRERHEVRPAEAEALRSMTDAARARLAYPRAVAPLLSALPGVESAPFRTESLTLERAEDGAFAGEVVVRLLDAATPAGESRGPAATERAVRAAGESVSAMRDGDGPDLLMTIRSRGETGR